MVVQPSFHLASSENNRNHVVKRDEIFDVVFFSPFGTKLDGRGGANFNDST